MDPVAECDLEAYLDEIGIEQMPTLRSFFGCLATALVYLHSHEILHLDIKPSNILIKRGNIFMADFGTAHDWSGRVRSTTWSSRPRTLPYMPPERENNPNAPCNSATDIWSLGVVFLEMLSVLRGIKPRQFKEYLRGKGTQQPFVWNNLTGTMSWLERLRTQSGPDYDNVPQTWVKDMLAREPHKRPFPKRLRHLIREAGHFCGFCCASFEQHDDFGEDGDFRFGDHQSTYSDRGLDDDFDEKYEEPGLNPAKAESIEDWLQRTDVATAKASKLKEQNGSFELNIVEDDDDTMVSDREEEDYSRPISQRLSGFDLLAGSHGPAPQSEDAPFGLDVKSDCSDDADSGSALELQSTLNSQDLAPITQQLSLLDDEGDDGELDKAYVLPVIEEESATINKINGLRDSAVSLDQDPQLSSLESDALQDPIVPQVHPMIVSGSQPVILDPAIPSNTSVFAYQVSEAPVLNDSGLVPSNEPDVVESKLGVDLTQQDEDRGFQPPPLKRSVTFAEQTNSPVISDSEVLGKTAVPTAASEQVRTDVTDTHPPNNDISSTRQPQRPAGGKSSSRSRPNPSSLTIANLSQLNRASPESADGAAPKTPRSARISPRKYMQKVSRETDSEVTSVMSEATRKVVQGMSISVWMAQDSPLLQHYVAKGKVGAVRALLENGCGIAGKVSSNDITCFTLTSQGLLFRAIKGKSLRHVKCADALLKAGADPNSRSTSTGKTALALAIDHDNYLGYLGLIHRLLSHGADPNIADASGDAPLLQILDHGYEPLEKYRRDALALLFEKSKVSVKVNISPLGTLNTPLHLAVRRKDPYAAGFLLVKNAKISERNGAGQTAFALAVTSWRPRMTDGQIELVRILLKAGADVNERLGPEGKPALHTAIEHGLVDIVELLLKYKADPSRQSKAGHTAFEACTGALADLKIKQQTAEEISGKLVAYNSVEDAAQESDAASSASSNSPRLQQTFSRYQKGGV